MKTKQDSPVSEYSTEKEIIMMLLPIVDQYPGSTHEHTATFDQLVNDFEIVFKCAYSDCRGEACLHETDLCPTGTHCVEVSEFDENFELVGDVITECQCDNDMEILTEADICIPARPDGLHFIEVAQGFCDAWNNGDATQSDLG